MSLMYYIHVIKVDISILIILYIINILNIQPHCEVVIIVMSREV